MNYLSLLLILAFSSTNLLALDVEGGDWKFLYKKDELSFYSKEVKDSQLLAFCAKGTINIALVEMLAILRDVEGTKRWDKNSKVKKTIKNISDIEANTYSVSTMPWPVTDRDMILNNKLHLDLKNGYMLVDAHSVDHKDYPVKDNKVRANMGIARFKIKYINAQKSYVEMYIHVDPRGSIPSWLVNYVQKDLPYEYLKNLEDFAQTVDEKPNRGVTKLYQTYMKDFNTRNK